MTSPAESVAPLDTTVAVETPEHVRFRHQVVGPTRRAAAWFIDVILRAAIVGALLLLLSIFIVIPEIGTGLTLGLGAVVVFLAEWFYFAAFEALWSGRTPGKRWTSLRVVRDNGQPIDATAAILRNLLRAVDFLPGLYAIGSAVMARDPKFRRLGDMAAGTMVVYEERKRIAQTFVLQPPASEEELAWVKNLPRLRLHDLKTIDLLLRRAARLHPDRVSELAEMIAPAYARRLGTRFNEPVRFLALLHHRARLKAGLR
jgi:uncharacterized RDD family membrane protein YckC